MTNENSLAEGTTQNQAPEEKKFSQAEVNEIASRVRNEAREHGIKMGMQQAQTSATAINPAHTADPAKIAEDVVNKRIQELQKQYQEQEQRRRGDQFAAEFDRKMALGKTKYPDFEKTVNPFINDLGKDPSNAHLLILMHAADNTGDIAYELAKPENVHKLANLAYLAEKMPDKGREAMYQLSQSIKQNEAATKQPQPNDPLGQVKPSISGADSGKPSLDDLRMKYL